jgi:hypothetical protein
MRLGWLARAAFLFCECVVGRRLKPLAGLVPRRYFLLNFAFCSPMLLISVLADAEGNRDSKGFSISESFS